MFLSVSSSSLRHVPVPVPKLVASVRLEEVDGWLLGDGDSWIVLARDLVLALLREHVDLGLLVGSARALDLHVVLVDNGWRADEHDLVADLRPWNGHLVVHNLGDEVGSVLAVDLVVADLGAFRSPVRAHLREQVEHVLLLGGAEHADAGGRVRHKAEQRDNHSRLHDDSSYDEIASHTFIFNFPIELFSI